MRGVLPHNIGANWPTVHRMTQFRCRFGSAKIGTYMQKTKNTSRFEPTELQRFIVDFHRNSRLKKREVDWKNQKK